MPVPLSKPDITEREIQAVIDVLRTDILSIGPKIQEFEQAIARCVGVEYAVGVNSGTSGLHLCVRSLGIQDGDEVITTPFSFVASANCILFERAKPVFVDIDPDTLNVNPDLIEEKINPRTKAILPVHAFGQPAAMDKIMTLAKKHNLSVIEDACEALGAEYKGRPAGSFGDMAVFAFYPNKQITTGEGGMIVTDNPELAELCRSMRSQGRAITGLWLHHERLGYNYRLSELNAVLGAVQMERLDEILVKREAVAQRYNTMLSKIDGVTIPYISPDVKMSWFVYVIKLDKKINRNKVLDYLISQGIGCRPYFTPIHLQPFYVEMFGYKRGDFPVTESVSDSTISLPFYNNITLGEQQEVCDVLQRAIELYSF